MGNTLAALDPKTIKKFDAFLAKYPKLLNRELLSDNKLFKTYSFLVEKETNIIMKVYFKRDDTSLKKHEISLNYMRQFFNLNIYPNILPYTKIMEESYFIALIRPKVSSTLQQRIQALPTLNHVEKTWIVFQLITAVYNLHANGFYHGALTSNNVLLTTWLHVFLADFAWFAPNYIYEDLLDDISFYYPSSLRRCNLAPEKLISRSSKESASVQRTHENIKEISEETLIQLKKMDIFSLGCIIAEIMLDGAYLFTYEQLLAYKKGKHTVDKLLDRIRDENIRNLITDMIQIDPNNRPDVQGVLKIWANQLAPPSFSQFIYYLNSSILSQNFVLPDQRIALIKELLEPIYRIVIKSPLRPHYEPLPIVMQHSQILQHFLRYYMMVQPSFKDMLNLEKFKWFQSETGNKDTLEFRTNIDPKDLKIIINNRKLSLVHNDKENNINQEEKKETELILVALMLCTNIRNLRYFASLKVALEIITNFTYYLPDQINLHMIIPYLFSLLDDQNPKTVVATFHVICDILSQLKNPVQFKSDRQIFEEQIFPNLLKAYNSNDTDVKSAFVIRIADIIKIGSLFITENLRFDSKIRKNEIVVDDDQSLPMPDDVQAKNMDDDSTAISNKLQADIDFEIKKWRYSFKDYIEELYNPHNQEITEALTKNFANLADALGEEMTENNLVPIVISALNDNRYKLISLEQIEKLIDFLSDKTIEGLIKPVVEKCITNADEMTIFQSVKNLNKIVRERKIIFKDYPFIVNTLLPLTIHPNSWIRDQTLEICYLVIDNWDDSDLYCRLQPALLKYSKKYEEFGLINSELFRMVVVDPISRRTYEDIKNKGYFDSIKDPQTKDLCAIFSEVFLKSINFENDGDSFKKSGMKPMKVLIEPRSIKNIEEVISNFCVQSTDKRIRDLTQFENNLLQELILVEADRERMNQLTVQSGVEELKTASDLSDVRSKLSFKIPELLTLQKISASTYIKNVHNFYLFTAGILRKRLQLQKKDKDLGYYERYERSANLSKEWEPQGFLIKTIYEHKDSVNCIDLSTDSRLFASGSDDGEVKIFDVSKLESYYNYLQREFTYNSVCTLSVKNDRNTEEYGLESKIKTIKFIDEERFAFGTSSGVIELHSVENDPAVDKGRNRKSQALRRWNVDGEVKSIQTLALQNRHKERTFMYVTHKGELGIQDINDKDLSVKFNLGKERGMISAMLTSALDYTVLIGTQRGYVMLYDIRANLLSSIYQLSSETPILSFANYHPISLGQPVNSQEALVGVSFGSDYHEVGFWNFSDFSKNAKNPEMYFYSSPNTSTECNPSYLRDASKSESIFNIRNSFTERKYYDYLAINSPAYDVLNYFSDSINHSQDMQREKWLSSSKNIYNNTSKAFLYRNSVHKIVCLPHFSPRELRSRMVPGKELQNIIFTAGNDMNIRYWNLSTNKFFHLYNIDGRKRAYNLTNTDMLVYQEIFSQDNERTGFSSLQNKNGCSLNVHNPNDKKVLAQAGHKDVVNDMLVVEKNDLIITCSKDKTIKVWK